MPLAGTEREIIETIALLKLARARSIAHQLSISLGYAHYLCRQLLRSGHIERLTHGNYQLTSKGRQFVSGKTAIHTLDSASVQAIAKEVAREIKKHGDMKRAKRDADDTREKGEDGKKEEPEMGNIRIKQGAVNITENFVKSYVCNFDKGIAEKRVSGRGVKNSAKKLRKI